MRKITKEIVGKSKHYQSSLAVKDPRIIKYVFQKIKIHLEINDIPRIISTHLEMWPQKVIKTVTQKLK